MMAKIHPHGGQSACGIWKEGQTKKRLTLGGQEKVCRLHLIRQRETGKKQQ